MVRQVLLVTLLAATSAVGVQAQNKEIKRGTIAVMAFGAANRDPAVMESARIIGATLEQELNASKRFVAVLPRGDAVEQAIKAELDRSTEPSSLQSLVRINQESQLNANYLMDGWVEHHTVTPVQGNPGETLYQAEIHVRVRIIDVETSGLFLSGVLKLNNNPIAGGPKLLKSALDVLGGGKDKSEADALKVARSNAQHAARELFANELSFLLLDYETGADGTPTGLVLLASPDLKKNTKLRITGRIESKLRPGEFREAELGLAQVTRLDAQYAYATFTQGQAEIAAALTKREPMVVRLSK